MDAFDHHASSSLCSNCAFAAKQLRIRCFQLMIAHSNATALQRAAGVGQGGKLMLKDFVPMIKAAWNSICAPERHKMCLKTCGYVPFTMAPAFKMLAEEKAREVEGQGVERTQWTNADLCTSVDKLHSGVIQHLTYAGGAPKGTINKAKALVAAAAGTPAATGATATAAAAVAPMTVEAMRAAMAAAAAELDFETAAALRDRIKAANAVAARRPRRPSWRCRWMTQLPRSRPSWRSATSTTPWPPAWPLTRLERSPRRTTRVTLQPRPSSPTSRIWTATTVPS